MKTDVAIIGGGIVGCASAYYLAKKGLRVVVLEKNAGVGLEASGRNGGGVRQHGRKHALPLAMESVRLWATLAEELESDLEYQCTGNLNIALDENTAASFEREINWENDHGLSEVRMLTATECQEMAPGMTERIVAGKYCPSDGIASPMLAPPAFARAGIKHGVMIMLNTSVVGLLQQSSRVCGVKTEREDIEAQAVINAAGPWAARFNAMAGCPIVIGPGRSQLMITERLPRQTIKPWISVRGFGYMRPTASGNLVLGSGGARNDNFSNHINYPSAKLHAETWCQYFPWLKDISIIRMFAGITEYTPDSEPYIGAVPGAPGLFIAAGFHAEGFCPGPMVGKILAELITGNEPSVSLEAFRPDRFADQLKNGNSPPKIVYPLEKMFAGKLAKVSIQTHSFSG